MKKLISLILIIAVIAVAVVFGPKLLHKCDDCGDFFVGTGYEPNLATEVIGELTNEKMEIICKDCAEDQHALELGLGLKTLDDFRLPLFD